MAEPHLDHPGEVSWFPGQHPGRVLGPCPHTRCPHDSARCVAWGPDLEHYTLDQCQVPTELGGCGGACRAWASEKPHPRGGVAYGWGPWLHVEPYNEGTKPADPPPATTAGPVPAPIAEVRAFPDVVHAAALLARPHGVEPDAYRCGVDAAMAAVFGELNARGWVIARPRDGGP